MEDWRIERDLKVSEKTIGKIEQGSYLNFEVIEENYIYPKTSTKVLPINHLMGLCSYHHRMSNVLKTALSIGAIMRSELPLHSPNYLIEIVSSEWKE